MLAPQNEGGNRVRRFVCTLAGLALLATLGCAPGRMADLRDSGRLGIGLGLGLSIDAKAGDLAHPALGVASVAAMTGFESRHIDGPFFDARIADPYATYWYRRAGVPWGFSLLSSGWRGVWEVKDLVDAVGEFDEPIDKEPPAGQGETHEGEVLDGAISASRWLGLPVGPGPLWTWNTASDMQVGVHALFINLRAGINPLEIFDLCAGFVGFDPAGDDQDAAH